MNPVVQARAYWKDIIVLDDGTQIPPHGEIDTFVAVRNGGVWRVASLNIHNQMPPFDVKPGEPLAVPYPPSSWPEYVGYCGVSSGWAVFW